MNTGSGWWGLDMGAGDGDGGVCVMRHCACRYELWVRYTSKTRPWLTKGLITAACDCLPPLPLTTAQCSQCYMSNCIGSLCNPDHSNKMALSTLVFAQHPRNPTLSGHPSDSAQQITTQGLLHCFHDLPAILNQFASSIPYQRQLLLSKVWLHSTLHNPGLSVTPCENPLVAPPGPSVLLRLKRHKCRWRV